MSFGQFIENEKSYVLVFERDLPQSQQVVFDALTNPGIFSKWYPFATGEMDFQVGGIIKFDDGEGSMFQGMITKFDVPESFEFVEDGSELIQMSVESTPEGSKLRFSHTFSNDTWVVPTATGWHNCLNVFEQILNGHPPVWPLPDELTQLTQEYEERFKKD